MLINQSKIYIEHCTLSSVARDFQNLFFFILNAVVLSQSILKTIIYMNTIHEIQRAVACLWLRLMKHEFTENVSKIIQLYFSLMMKRDKTRISQEFQIACLCHRIIIVTDAMRMRMNIFNIVIVVQWLISSDANSIVQRMSWAAWESDHFEHFIWITSSVFSNRKSQVVKRAI